MSSQPPSSDPEREYTLISKLELRIASASTDAKFESVIDKFLPALILKLASPTEKNRNLAIKVCQYINQRVKINTEIKLPAEALVKTFREAENAFVRRFCLLFIEQGLPRLEVDQGIKTLPGVLQFAIPKTESYDATDRKMWAIAFDFALEVLRRWKTTPERGSKEDLALKATFSLTPMQTDLLVSRFCDFLLYDLKTAPSSPDDDFHPIFEKNFKRRSEVVLPLARFLFTSIFDDRQRLIPAVIMSVDANASAANVSDVMFKQCNFDLEAEVAVAALFALYKRCSSKPKLQTRILTILSRSEKSTSHPDEIMSMVETQLNTSNMGLEAAKLRTALFSYLTWTVRVGQHHLGGISHRVQDLLKEYVEMQGWPTMNERSPAEVELRAKAYESIGLLAAVKTAPNTVESDVRLLDLITWLFTSLRCDTTREVKGSIEESIGRLMNAVTSLDESSTRRLKDLLLWNVLATPGQEDPVYFLPTMNSTKYPAVRFVNKFLPFHDVDGRFINVLALALADDRREIAEEGVRGLDPYWHVSNARLITSGPSAEEGKLTLPNIEALAERFFGKVDSIQLKDDSSHGHNNLGALSAAVAFCRNVLVCDALKDTKLDAPEDSADWKQSIDALVNNEADARRSIREYLRSLSLKTKLTLLNAALAGMARGSGECLDLSLELVSLAPNDLLPEIRQAGLDASSSVAFKMSLQLRAARIFGILVSTSDDAESLSKSELEQIQDWKSAVGEEAVRVQGHILRACFCLTRRSLRAGADSNISDESLAEMKQLVSDIITQTSDKSLRETAYRCLRQLGLCLPTEKRPTLSDELLNKLISDGKKENELAVSAIGPLVGTLHATADEAQFGSFLDRFLGLHEVKRAEFHFAMGESLAVACAGLRSSSTMTEFDVDADLPSWSHSNETLTTAILDRVIGDCKTTKPSLKKAAAIWLLCLIQYCGDAAAIKSRLRDCQAVFARLLNDRDEIVQETGSRGLSVVYEHGDKQLRDDLVRDLVQTFTGSNAKMSGTVSDDTQLFEAGALPTENGQSVTTYKDIVRLATEMGDPSLVYRFMNLASNNAIWTSRAAFGRFGLGSILADSTYLSENKKFYPKLFRYRFDPNPNVQRSMNEIWKALVKDPTAVINDNFDLIMEDLLKSIVSGKEWRAREASCAAISDLVQGRDVEVFEKYLDEIWTVAFKVLDDVKESVRVAAMKLCRTLTSMLIRNLEVGEGNSKRARAMVNHAMPFLLQQMDGAGGKEVQQYAIVTLLEIVKKCPPKSLQPFAPTILETLVVSLSSLEHESINYLHLNADKYGLTAEKLDKMRVSSINASPVTEAIELCLDSITMRESAERSSPDDMEGVVSTSGTNDKQSPMDDAMQRLVNAYRAAIGLPSKVGLTRVMTALVVRHPTAFRPYADKFVQLTRKHILDRNATISVAFSTSLGYLMRLASQKEVLATSKHAQKLYFESQELMHRSVAGEIVQAISKAANDVFMNSASVFLPFAFIGRRDTDKEVRERFDPPWKENIGGSRSINLYLTEIVGLISTHIKSPLWPIRHACSFAVSELVASMDDHEKYTPNEATLIWGVMQEALAGKTWEGKEEIIKVYPKFVRQAQSFGADSPTSQQMKKIAIREAKRTNVEYRPHAIEALGEFAMARKDLDLTQEVVPYLADTLDELTDQDAMDVDDTSGKSFNNRVVETTVPAIVSCLFKLLTAHADVEILAQATAIVHKAQALRSSVVDGALYDSTKFFVINCPDDHAARRATKGYEDENASASDNGAPATVSGGGSRPAAGVASEASVVGEGRTRPGPPEAFERFEPLVLAVLSSDESRQASEPEHQRKSRVALALALAERGVQDSAGLAAILSTWDQTERSRPLREDIRRARLLASPGP